MSKIMIGRGRLMKKDIYDYIGEEENSNLVL